MDFSYSSTTYKAERTEITASDRNQFESQDDLSLLRLTIGMQYYFITKTPARVAPSITFGIGKQFAFATRVAKSSSSDIYDSFSDNIEEYIEDMNSPFLLVFGLGAEYAFNHSLSLFSAVRLYYSSYSAEYNRKNSDPYYPVTIKEKTEESEIYTRVGLGLIYYF
jgi:hypothetical protein